MSPPILIVLFALAGLLLLRLLVYAIGAGDKFDSSLTNIASKGVGASNRVVSGVFSFAEIFRLPHHLRWEKILEGELSLANTKLAELEQLKRENAELRKLLSLPPSRGFGKVAAEVVARSPEMWLDYLIINRGRSSGINVKDLVVSDLGLIGEISEVGKTYSVVKTLTNPDFSISAITSLSQTAGIIKGTGTTTIRLDYISADAKINIGEKLYTLGISLDGGDTRPAGILIGYVSKIRKVPGLTTLQVLAEPSIGTKGIKTVVVLTKFQK